MSNDYVILLDPSLIDNSGTPSTNIGDLIIYDSVSKILGNLFPEMEIIRISTHEYPEQKHIDLMRNSQYNIIGGTNLLSSHLRQYNQWKTYTKLFGYLFPQFGNVVLLGVGWWQYQDRPDYITGRFYRKVLSQRLFHSVRDSYTKEMLGKSGISNCINTSCPTLWQLNGRDINHRNPSARNCLFTLTDYYPDPENDNKLIRLILGNFTGDILFFPQGTEDVAYIETLPEYSNNSARIKILQRDLQTFDEALNSDVCYIGTRLHAGIRCIANSVESLILAVDNRAVEIGRDVNLPLAGRSDIDKISAWIHGNVEFDNISLPLEDIDKWKSQFQDYHKNAR